MNDTQRDFGFDSRNIEQNYSTMNTAKRKN